MYKGAKFARDSENKYVRLCRGRTNRVSHNRDECTNRCFANTHTRFVSDFAKQRKRLLYRRVARQPITAEKNSDVFVLSVVPTHTRVVRDVLDQYARQTDGIIDRRVLYR